MASPTVQPHELHNESQISIPSDHSNMRPESITSARSAKSPPPGSKHRLSADEKIRSMEAAQAMEYLEAETGFASYAAYSYSLGDNPAYHTLFLFAESLDDSDANSRCAIIDLLKEEDSPPKASLRCENLSAVQALQSLRTPTKGVDVQIVLWSFNNDFDEIMDQQFVTVFGLGLKLNPRFFQTLADKLPRSIPSATAVNEWSLPEYLFIDGTIVAIARDCPLAKPGGPPFLLIAACGGLDYHIEKDELDYPMRAAFPTRTSEDLHPNVEDSRLYAQLLTASMNQNPDCTISCEALLFGSLLPLLQLDILRMRGRCSHVRKRFQKQKVRAIRSVVDEIDNSTPRELFDDDTVDARLYRHRAFLRSLIVTFEGSKEPLVRFITSQLAPELTTAPAYDRISEEQSSILKEARSLEAEIRDFLQLQAGQLSLLESRKSIEVSNNQLQEGKRGKYIISIARKQC